MTQNSIKKMSIKAKLLGIYFLLTPFDLFLFGSISLLKIYSVFLIAYYLISSKPYVKLGKSAYSILFFLLFSLLTILYSINISTSLSMGITLFLNLMLVLIVVNNSNFTRNEFDFFKFCLAIGGLLSLILISIFSDYSAAGRLNLSINGQKSDPNTLNGYFVFPLVYFLEQAFVKNKKLLIFLIIPIFIVALSTGSRGGLLGLLVGAIVFILTFLSYSKSKARIRGLLFVLLFIMFIMMTQDFWLKYIPNEVINRFSFAFIEDSGTTGRTDIWKGLFDIYKDSDFFRQLFGFGIGTTHIVSESIVVFNMSGYAAHNLWLDEIITGGFFGLCFLIYMQITLFCSIFRRKNPFLVACFCSFMTLCISLSLISFKPIWNCFMLIIIYEKIAKQSNSSKEITFNTEVQYEDCRVN